MPADSAEKMDDDQYPGDPAAPIEVNEDAGDEVPISAAADSAMDES
jgi:hypothetical protein